MNKRNTSIDPLINKMGTPVKYTSGNINFDPAKIKRFTKGTETNRRLGGISKKAAAFALGATVAAGFYFANSQLDNADKEAAINFEQDVLQNNPKTVMNGQLVLESGVRIRTTPVMSNPSEESEGNIAFPIPEGTHLIIDYPVSVETGPEEQWIAVNIKGEEGPESGPETIYVSSQVLSQKNDQGIPYASFIPYENQELLGAEVNVNSLGVMTAEGQAVAMGYFGKIEG